MLATKLFFKHLFTGIKRRPAQPILLVVIIMFSVAVSISAFDIKGYFTNQLKTTSDAENGKADIVVSCSPAMDERFLFSGQVSDVLPEGTDICGVYKLPFYVGEQQDFVYAVATDFATVNTMFEFDFINITPIGEKEIKVGAYVSDEFAQKFGYEVGNTFTAELFGYKKTYTIFGITKSKIMNNFGIMVDVKGVTEQLLTGSISLQVLGNEFCPIVSLYVNSNGKTEEVSQILSETVPLASIEIIDWTKSAVLPFLDLIIVLLNIISVLFSFAVTYCCFYVLSKQRAEENTLFYAVGTKQYILNLMSLAEMFVYWFLGSILGIALACPLEILMIYVIGFRDTALSLSGTGILISVSIMLVAAECSIGGFIAVERWRKNTPKQTNEKKKNRMRFIGTVILAVVIAVFATFASILPMMEKKLPSILLLLSLLVGSFLFALQATNTFSKKFSHGDLKNKPFLYALKNTQKVMSLCNFSGLISLLLAIIFSLSIIGQYGRGQKAFAKDFINGEYLLVNANKGMVETVKGIEGTENVNGIFFASNVEYKDDTFVVMSFPEMSNFGEGCEPELLPHGEEVVLAQPIADKYGLQVGNTWSVNYGNKQYNLKVVGFWHTSYNFALIDNQSIGLTDNYILVKEKEDASEDYYQRLLSKSTENNVSVVPLSNLLSGKEEENNLLIIYLNFSEIVLCLYAIIGIVNSLVSGYRSRKEEFNCYIASGMNHANLRKLKAYEVIFAFLIGMAVCILLAGLYWIGVYDLFLSMASNIVYAF